MRPAQAIDELEEPRLPLSQVLSGSIGFFSSVERVIPTTNVHDG
jgi:hypothetical protein